jgi:hypothetical protein
MPFSGVYSRSQPNEPEAYLPGLVTANPDLRSLAMAGIGMARSVNLTVCYTSGERHAEDLGVDTLEQALEYGLPVSGQIDALLCTVDRTVDTTGQLLEPSEGDTYLGRLRSAAGTVGASLMHAGVLIPPDDSEVDGDMHQALSPETALQAMTVEAMTNPAALAGSPESEKNPARLALETVVQHNWQWLRVLNAYKQLRPLLATPDNPHRPLNVWMMAPVTDFDYTRKLRLLSYRGLPYEPEFVASEEWLMSNLRARDPYGDEGSWPREISLDGVMPDPASKLRRNAMCQGYVSR